MYNVNLLHILTFISEKEWHQKVVLFREDTDEFLEISDASASKKLGQPFVAVTWLYNVVKMISL